MPKGWLAALFHGSLSEVPLTVGWCRADAVIQPVFYTVPGICAEVGAGIVRVEIEFDGTADSGNVDEPVCILAGKSMMGRSGLSLLISKQGL